MDASRKLFKQHPFLFSTLLLSKQQGRALRKVASRVKVVRLLWACCALLLMYALVTALWWAGSVREALASTGLKVDTITRVLQSKDPGHEAALVARDNPQMVGIARHALMSVMKASERVVVVPELHRVVFDVSAEGTFGFVFNHMMHHHKESLFPELVHGAGAGDPRLRMVVDFGAFDGLIASNSYNFLELGWTALLVEPSPTTFKVLHQTTARFEDRKFLENVAVGDEDKDVTFYVYDNPTSNSLFQRDEYAERKKQLTVPMRRASGILNSYRISKKFGVLSIDVEGMEKVVLDDVLEAGYRPRYIIMEKITLGKGQLDLGALVHSMDEKNYSLLAQIHLNCIFHYDG